MTYRGRWIAMIEFVGFMWTEDTKDGEGYRGKAAPPLLSSDESDLFTIETVALELVIVSFIGIIPGYSFAADVPSPFLSLVLPEAVSLAIGDSRI